MYNHVEVYLVYNYLYVYNIFIYVYMKNAFYEENNHVNFGLLLRIIS
jgi:hypothetical protein